MIKLLAFMFMIIAFSCTKGSQQENCENEYGTLGNERFCLMQYGFIESQKEKSNYKESDSDPIKFMLLDCLVHYQKLRQCSKKPDYLPAW